MPPTHFSVAASLGHMIDAKAHAYILGRIKAMHKHTDPEVETLSLRMREIRCKFHSSQQEWHVKPIFVGFHGFASDFERSVFLRCVKYCTKPRVVHSAFMPNGAFEGVLVLHPTTPRAEVQDLEALVELFKMSAGVTDLGGYMSPPMIACIERVETGRLHYGNWRSLRAACVRNAYLHAKQKRDTDAQYERVRLETGLPFSTTNMLAIHYQLNNTQIEVHQASDLLVRLRRLMGSLPPSHTVAVGTVTQPSIMHSQYILNMQQLIDNLLHSFHPPHEEHNIRAVIIDLTA